MRMEQTLSGLVAANVRAELARMKIGQSALADRLALSQATVSRRLSGESAFELDELPGVADVLGVPVLALMSATSGEDEA
jgi:transcriptional regulator with XRE-family HTH domain